MGRLPSIGAWALWGLAGCSAADTVGPDPAGKGAAAGKDATVETPALDAAPAPEANTREPGSSADTGAAEIETIADDASSPDARDATGDSALGCAGLVCEDFELGQIDPARWDLVLGSGGTAKVQQDIVHHGKYALQVHALAGPASDYAFIVSKNAPAALRATNFGRAYFFITPKPLTSGHTQMVFAGSNGTGSATGPEPFTKLRYMEVANINGGWQIGFDLLDISPLVEEVTYPAGSPQVPTMTWSCLEWEFTDQPDIVNLWVDAKAIGTFDDSHVSYPPGHVQGTPLYGGKSTGLIGSYTQFGFGFHDWHPNKPFDLYYDDIVLDTKRVGCVP